MSRTVRRRARSFVLCAACLAAGCGTEPSVLVAKGEEAERIEGLTHVLLLGGALILAIVVIVLAAAILLPDRHRQSLADERTIMVGGIAFPAVVMTALLAYGVSTTAGLRAETDPALRVFVEGKQWWWRVRYEGLGLDGVESANEIRLPVGRPVEFVLSSGDVVHSFWVPNLAGKLDMIPGRTTRLSTRATVSGEMRGQCAEFCGGPHGSMGLRVIAMPAVEFGEWATRRSRPLGTLVLSPGPDLFLAAGCGGCHTVKGTEARGTIGPNLTDFGARRAIAAETLSMSRENIANWIVHNQAIKPENIMPAFAHLSAAEVSLLAAYLEQLK
jgi:cytochrome c oxidase subunit 2